MFITSFFNGLCTVLIIGMDTSGTGTSPILQSHTHILPQTQLLGKL